MLNKSLLIEVLASIKEEKVRQKEMQQGVQAETDLANVLNLRFQLTARKDQGRKGMHF